MASRKVKPKQPAKRGKYVRTESSREDILATCRKLFSENLELQTEIKSVKESALSYHLATLKIEGDLKAQLEAVRSLYSAATDRNVSLIRALQQILADSPADLQGNRFAVPAAKIRELIA